MTDIEVVKEGNKEYEVYRVEKNNKPIKHGYFKEYWPDKTYKIVGNYIEGRGHGKWVSFYESGEVESELYYNKDGKKVGKSVKYYENGQVWYEANYKDGELDGNWVCFHEDGKTKKGAYYKNGWEVYDVRYDDNGKALQGTFVYHYMNGQIKIEENRRDGMKDGKCVSYHMDGHVKEETSYKEGKVDGKSVVYYENGKIKDEGNYKDGSNEGKWVRYHENGMVYRQGNYKDGKRDGEWVFYWENGQLHYRINYTDGEVADGRYITYDENGKKIIVTVKDGYAID